MKQRARIFELSNQGLNESQIESKLKIEFGQQAYCCKTIHKWIGRQKLVYEFDEKGDKTGPKVDDQLLKRIEQCLNENPFASTRSIAQHLREDDSTIWRYLKMYLGRVYKHSRWIPHSLDSVQKHTRMIQSNAIVNTLYKNVMN